VCDPNREFENENRFVAELPNRVWSIFDSTRLVEIADPVVLGGGWANLRSGAVILRFDAHPGAALREDADDPKLFADVWWPWPFQLLVAPPRHELDGPRVAVTEEFARFPNECHWPSLLVVEGPRAAAKEEFPRFPNECHWPSLVVVEGPRAAVTEEFPRLPNECHCPSPEIDDGPRAAKEFPRFPNECHRALPLAKPLAAKFLEKDGPAEWLKAGATPGDRPPLCDGLLGAPLRELRPAERPPPFP